MDSLGIYSSKAAGAGFYWGKGRFSQGFAPLIQGHKRLTVLLTVFLLPDGSTGDAKGECQDFECHFPRNRAIDDEECCI